MTNDLAHDPQNARPVDLARERVEELVKTAPAWAKADLSDDETARRAADYFNQVRGEAQRIEEERKAEKKPSWDAGKAIDELYAAPAALLTPAWEIIHTKVEQLLKTQKANGIEHPTLKGNYSSRAIALKGIWRAKIIDQLQLYLYYQDHPDLLAVLQKLADAEAPAAHRENRKIPGAELIEKEIAA